MYSPQIERTIWMYHGTKLEIDTWNYFITYLFCFCFVCCFCLFFSRLFVCCFQEFSIPGTNSSVAILFIDTVILAGLSHPTLRSLPPPGPKSYSFAIQEWEFINETLSKWHQSGNDNQWRIVVGHYPGGWARYKWYSYVSHNYIQSHVSYLNVSYPNTSVNEHPKSNSSTCRHEELLDHAPSLMFFIIHFLCCLVIWTFQLSEHLSVPTCSDNWHSTVYACLYVHVCMCVCVCVV